MRIKEIAEEIHEINKSKGFWDNKKTKNVGEMLMLVTSELAEALEADRDNHKADREAYSWGLSDEWYEGRDKANFEKHIKNSFEDEIADAVIRLFDISEGLGIDLEWHIREKVNYNKSRPHKHGKAY